MGRASRLKREKRERELLALRLQLQILEARPTQTDQKGIWRRIPLIGKAAIGFAAALLSLFAALVTFLPRVSMEPGDRVDPSDPLSETFTVTNSGIGSLYDVTAGICIGQIIMNPISFNPQQTFTLPCSEILRPEWKNHTLRMDERFTVTLQGIIEPGPGSGATISGADIAVLVQYHPWFMPFHREKAFRFITHSLPNKDVYWSSMPLQ